MCRVGVYPGRFAPPHRGHLTAILEASCKVDKLYVVVSHHEGDAKSLYTSNSTKPITLKQKVKWLSIELSEFPHIKVLGQDESCIPLYPYGWEQYAEMLRETVPEPFQVIFGGDAEYQDGYTKYYPECEYMLHDRNERYKVSATEIRKNPYKYWDYILGSAREHFVKRVLITGTESCGKTTLTKSLAKIFFTSWAREEGRYYSTKYFGGNESVYELEDFHKIAWEQRQIEDHAIRTANKIVFFDTDAVVTQYYCQMYTGTVNPKIETLVDPDRYDLVLFLNPDVKWVADGYRFKGEQGERQELHRKLLRMYRERGFKDKIILEVCGGDYHGRLKGAIEASKSLLEQP